MIYIFNKKRLKKYTAILTSLVILLVNYNLSFGKIVFAEEDSENWVVTDDNGKRVNGDTIFWNGTHSSGSDNMPRYRTLYYYMSRVPYDTKSKFTLGNNAKIDKKKLYVQVDKVSDVNGIKVRSYSISREEFMNAAIELGISAEDFIDGKEVVYLNPVYERYVDEKVLVTPVFGLQEMLDLGWSSTTNALLPDLYNVKYTLTAQNIYNVKVSIVDGENNILEGAKNKDGVIIDNPLYSGKLIAYQSFSYKLPTANTILKLGTSTYSYNHYEYEYTQRSPKKTIKNTNQNTSTTVSFNKAPDALPGSTLTIKLVYEPAQVKYNYKIQAVDETNKFLKDIVKGPIATESGKTVEYKNTADITVNNTLYKYNFKWFLTYTNLEGKTITEPVKSGTISKKMPAAKEGTTAVFSMIYTTKPVTPEVPTSEIPEIEVPESDSVSLDFTTVVTTGNLKADVRGTERFIAKQGVPTTESLYGDVTAMEYLLGYSFVKRVGIEYYEVEVSKDYILEWNTATPDSAGGSKKVTETVTVRQTITVPRAYGYWEIENLECYQIDNAIINNYALPGGSITIYPNYTYYNPPTVGVYHSEDKKYHIIPPDEVENGIKLEAVTITADQGQETRKPAVPMESFSEEAKIAALVLTGKAKVKSDSLTFNGRTVISSEVRETEAPDINLTAIPQCEASTHDNALYKPGNIIEATKLNGTYPTTGTITYTVLAKVKSHKPDRPQYNIDGLDKVVIHTPVVCIPTIAADNDKFVQLINPTKGCVQLVLDPEPTLSDFTVHISNIGFHTGKQGYFTRDFSKSLRDPINSYIASENGLLRNQVKFPFDVYIDSENNNGSTDDDFIKAGTWITIDRSTPRFYLPMTVNEGVYTVNFRSIAVNGTPFLTNTEIYANTQLINYVATDTLNVEVSGRIYGLTIYDITDYPTWENTFRVPNSLDFKKDSNKYPIGTSLVAYNSGRSYTYTIGTNNQYGIDTDRNNKYTFPLVNGSHPQYSNQGILKTGYMFRFSLDTIGNMFSDSCKVSIKPNFYFLDKNGKNRVAVDLYYTESINNKTHYLVKVGSGLDQTNIKNVKIGDLYLGIPKGELKQTATLRGIPYRQFSTKYSPMFHFSEIRLNWAFRTYVNNDYLLKVKSYDSYTDVTANGISQGDILERMQRWYGQYYIPNEVHVVEKGFDVMDYADKHGVDYYENFWLKEGYIIVNFTIETVGENGSRRLSYINATNYKKNDNCSMWLLEGAATSKSSHKGPMFSFFAGDCIIYYSNKKMSDDYGTGAIY